MLEGNADEPPARSTELETRRHRGQLVALRHSPDEAFIEEMIRSRALRSRTSLCVSVSLANVLIRGWLTLLPDFVLARID
jgi:hypothetical protein